MPQLIRIDTSHMHRSAVPENITGACLENHSGKLLSLIHIYYKKPIVDTYRQYLADHSEIFKGREDKFVCLDVYKRQILLRVRGVRCIR